MLRIFVPSRELFDETNNEFVTQEGFELEIEHSLVSLSKWESKFEKSFLSNEHRSSEELYSYIECMIPHGKVPNDLENRLSAENLKQIANYIDSSQSATKFGDLPKTPKKAETITSELIYYWLVVFNIPFDVETWHLNRLFSLIRICNIKNQKPTKRSKAELSRQYRELNEQRRAKYNTKG